MNRGQLEIKSSASRSVFSFLFHLSKIPETFEPAPTVQSARFKSVVSVHLSTKGLHRLHCPRELPGKTRSVAMATEMAGFFISRKYVFIYNYSRI